MTAPTKEQIEWLAGRLKDARIAGGGFSLVHPEDVERAAAALLALQAQTEELKGALARAETERDAWRSHVEEASTYVRDQNELLALEQKLATVTEEREALRAERDTLLARLEAAEARASAGVYAAASHVAWIDSERTGPDYGSLTRDTHPDGEAIWGRWWSGQLAQCDMTEKLARHVLALGSQTGGA